MCVIVCMTVCDGVCVYVCMLDFMVSHRREEGVGSFYAAA